MADDWLTPPDLAEDLGTFDLDPCSHPAAHIKAARRITLPEDGLTATWGDGRVWCNPPYSKPLPWCRLLRAHAERRWLNGFVALVKLDPTTRWWDELVRPTVHGQRGWQDEGWPLDRRLGRYFHRYGWAPFRKRLRFWTAEGKPAPHVAEFPCALVWRHWAPSERLLTHWLWT